MKKFSPSPLQLFRLPLQHLLMTAAKKPSRPTTIKSRTSARQVTHRMKRTPCMHSSMKIFVPFSALPTSRFTRWSTTSRFLDLRMEPMPSRQHDMNTSSQDSELLSLHSHFRHSPPEHCPTILSFNCISSESFQ